jgi:hypothetical protein
VALALEAPQERAAAALALAGGKPRGRPDLRLEGARAGVHRVGHDLGGTRLLGRARKRAQPFAAAVGEERPCKHVGAHARVGGAPQRVDARGDRRAGRLPPAALRIEPRGKRDPDLGPLHPRKHVEVAHNERRLREHRHRPPRARKHLEAAPCDLELPLDGLVGVGHGGQPHDPPRLALHLARKGARDPALHEDRGCPRGAVDAHDVGRIAVQAIEGAPAVGVERPVVARKQRRRKRLPHLDFDDLHGGGCPPGPP